MLSQERLVRRQKKPISFKKGNTMDKKLLISQSIMWASAILIVAIVDEKQFASLLLIILAAVSLMKLRKSE